MRWLKREMWKTRIAIAGVLLLLAFMIWVPASIVGAYDATSELATPLTGTVQATPTEDGTVAALNKEKLVQEVQQLKNQNAPILLLAGSERMHPFSSQRSLWLSVPFLAFGAGV